MPLRGLLLLLALAAGARADAGPPPAGEPHVVPFFIRHEPTGASLLGALHLEPGRILWTAPLPLEKNSWPSLSWNGEEVSTTWSGPGGARRTSIRDLLSGRPRLELQGGYFQRLRDGDRLLLIDLHHEQARGVDGRTGELLWTLPKAGSGRILHRAAAPLVLFHQGSRLTAVEPIGGRERWTRDVGPSTNLYSGTERLWIHARETSIVRELDPETGRDARAVEVGTSIESLSLDAGRLLVGVKDRVVSFRTSDLSTEWTWRTAETPTSVWGSGSAVIVDHPERRKSFLDARTGVLTGRLAYQESQGTSASLGFDGLYIFQVNGHTGGPQARILSTVTGAVLWEGDDADVYRDRASRILLVRRGKELSRLDPRSGAALWTIPTAPIRSALVQRHRIVLLCGRHAIALDASRGRELWRVELPAEATRASFGWRSPI